LSIEFNDLEFVFHIGMPKCASTFLQSEVFPNFNINYLNEYYYFSEKTSEPLFWTVVRNILSKQSYLIKEVEIESFREKLVSMANSNNNNKFLFSSEELVGFYSQNFSNNLSIFENLVKYYGKNIKLILVIRKQDQFLESLYRQSIKMGHWVSVNTFLNYQNNKFNKFQFEYKLNLDLENFDWLKMFEAYKDKVGEKNLIVLPYELVKDDSSKFVRKIEDFIGIDYLDRPIGNKILNPSYSYFTLVLLRFLNRFLNNGRNPLYILVQTPLNVFLRRYKNDSHPSKSILLLRKINRALYLSRLIRIFNIIRYKRNFISEKISKEIVNSHSKNNEILSNKRHLNLDKYGYF
jgi:hypothetical protein